MAVMGRQVSGARVAAGDHCVQFYADDEDRFAPIAAYLRGGLRQGQTVVVVAEPGTRVAVEAGLSRLGVPVQAARCAGRLLLPDTAALTSRLASPAALPPDVRCAVAAAFRRAAAAGRPVRAYGETAALLPPASETGRAVEVERLWTSLARRVPLALLCGYPWSLVGSPAAAGLIAAVCGLHSGVPRGLPVLPGTEAGCRFSRSGQSPAEARRFVTSMLDIWGLARVAGDAALLVTEMAFNAIQHARSGFTVSLSRRRQDQTLRIGVGDGSPALPRRKVCPTSRQAGGLDIVTAFATGWGHDLTPDGKLIWADLAAGSGGQ